MTDHRSDILVLADGKPGHVSQIKGLIDAIVSLNAALACNVQWLDVRELNWREKYTGRLPRHLQKPRIIIAAGHSTHVPALAYRARHGGHLIVIMKPSLPLSWFDSVIMPQHDLREAPKDNVFCTVGAMNSVGFLPRSDTNTGLILLGGESKYYHWNQASLLEQIDTVLQANGHLNWTITNSRRSPASLESELLKHFDGRAEIKPVEQCPPGWLTQELVRSKTVWITPDSVSMVYESLSSGAQCGLFYLKAKQRDRITEGMSDLSSSGQIDYLAEDGSIQTASAPINRLNEAHRAAVWLSPRILRPFTE
jgi:mitochondrial fission protein ELM1